MKVTIFFIALVLLNTGGLHAQQFINKAVIEYEVKSNIKKTMGNNTWAEMLKDKLPEFKIGYYNFTFADNKSIYKLDHWGEPKLPKYMTEGDEDNVWYLDYNTGKYNTQKNVYGSNFNIMDSIHKLHWKITNENRIIAGFNCRKAVAIIFDSVYVFAFYTDEITIPGGPCSIHGLPGMILGVTIPRLYTSWIATKVMVNDVDINVIKPVVAKKEYPTEKLVSLIKERTKDWYSDDPAENKEYQEQKDRFIWTTLL